MAGHPARELLFSAFMRYLNFKSRATGAGMALPLVLALSLLHAGCGKKSDSEPGATPASAVETKSAKAEVPVGDADLLQNIPIGAAVTNVAMAAGDKAWREVLQSVRPPSTPPEWATKEPSKEEIAAFEKKNGMLAAEAASRMNEF
jgi:hypothetical protein